MSPRCVPFLAFICAGAVFADDGWSPETDQKPSSNSSSSTSSSGSSSPVIHDGASVPATGSVHPSAIYLHPLSLLISTGVDAWPNYLAMTLEREIGPASSIVVMPNVIWGNLGTGADPIRIRSWGAKVGYRSYFNDREPEGFFGGPSLEYSSYILTDTDLRLKATVTGILGYFGYRAKWDRVSLFVDAGLGFGFVSITGDTKLLSKSYMGGGADYGVDFGLGVPF